MLKTDLEAVKCQGVNVSKVGVVDLIKSGRLLVGLENVDKGQLVLVGLGWILQ